MTTSNLPMDLDDRDTTQVLATKLVESAEGYLAPLEVAVLHRAIEAAADAHTECEERLDKTPYIDHALRVAIMVADWNAPIDVLASAVLHDVLKPKYSRHADREWVESGFGPVVADLVAASSQLGRTGRRTLKGLPDGASGENGFLVRTLPWVVGILRKWPDAVVIKLADRLENFESLKVIDPIRSGGFSSATQRVFVPCADWLGMWDVKRRLEDKAFEKLNPEAYKDLSARYNTVRSGSSIGGFGAAVGRALNNLGLGNQVSYVPRSIHSLYRDEYREGGQALPDQVAHPLLVLVDSVQDCYKALAVIHSMWPARRRRLSDYISTPKPNGYRALHTVVDTASGPLPIRIRSHTMNLVAEHGITAQWQGAPREWAPQLPAAENAPPGMIAVYSTSGDCFILGKGATPVDFALARGEEYGIRCVQALVNEFPGDLDHSLENGDVVRIFTSRADAGSPGRLSPFARLEQSRDVLKRASEREHMQAAATRGWHHVAAELGRLRLTGAPSQVTAYLRSVATRMEFRNTTELLIAVDSGAIAPEAVAGYMRELTGERQITRRPHARVSSLVAVDREITYAGCCNPAPPDEIVAYPRKPNRLVIHRSDCGNVRRPDRVVPAEWEEVPWQRLVAIEVLAADLDSLLQNLGRVMKEEGLSMCSFHADQKFDGSATAHIGLGDIPTVQLSDLLVRIRAIDGVSRASTCGPSLPAVMALDGTLARHFANPYTLLPVSGLSVYGRDEEMAQLLDNLSRLKPSESVLIWGPRRIGKTSMLREFARSVLSADHYTAIFVDLQALSGDSVVALLELAIKEVVETLQNPSVVAPTAAKMSSDPLTEFKRVMHSADDFDSRQIVMIFDDVEVLSELDNDRVSIDDVMTYMRSLMLNGASVSFVFCGGGALQTLLDNTAAASLFNVTQFQSIGCLDDQAARRLVTEPVTRVRFSEDAVTKLLDITANHPYYLQMVCSQLLTDADGEERDEIELEHVESLIRTWLPLRPEYCFSHFWGEQTSMSRADTETNRSVLVSVIENCGANGWTKLVDLDMPNTGKPFNGTLQKSLRALRDLGTVTVRSDEIRVSIPLCKEWVAANLVGRRPKDNPMVPKL